MKIVGVIICNLFKRTFMIVSIVDSLSMQVQVVVLNKEKTPPIVIAGIKGMDIESRTC